MKDVSHKMLCHYLIKQKSISLVSDIFVYIDFAFYHFIFSHKITHLHEPYCSLTLKGYSGAQDGILDVVYSPQLINLMKQCKHRIPRILSDI